MTTTLQSLVQLTRADTLETVGRDPEYITIGTNRQGEIMTLGMTEVVISVDSTIGGAGLLYVKNHATGGYVDLGYATADYPNRVYAGEPGLIPLAIGTSQIYVVASEANTKFEYEITERSL